MLKIMVLVMFVVILNIKLKLVKKNVMPVLNLVPMTLQKQQLVQPALIVYAPKMLHDLMLSIFLTTKKIHQKIRKIYYKLQLDLVGCIPCLLEAKKRMVCQETTTINTHFTMRWCVILQSKVLEK